MSAGVSSQPNHSMPYWASLLARRGLSEATIAHFAITPHRDGWQYPLHPALDVRRWKAFDSSATPKYLWLPNKPANVRFYDVDGSLRDEIARADGNLWLASGEPDVWALWEGGIRNATCLFDGETRRIPAWFAAELKVLRVRTLHLVPDRDRSGMRFVVNISRAVSDTSIRVIMHQLPFPPRSKGDVGRLLQQVGAAQLKASLRQLRAYECEFEPLTAEEKRTPAQLSLPNLSSDRDASHDRAQDDLYEDWCVDVVEYAAVRAWSLSPPDTKGFSKNIHCPFHDDTNPSAGWSYETHGIYCFACGYHDAREVAAMLRVQSWESFQAARTT